MILIKHMLISSVHSESGAGRKAVPYRKSAGEGRGGKGWWGGAGPRADKLQRSVLRHTRVRFQEKTQRNGAAPNRNGLHRAGQWRENMGPFYRMFPLDYFRRAAQFCATLHLFHRRKTLLPHHFWKIFAAHQGKLGVKCLKPYFSNHLCKIKEFVVNVKTVTDTRIFFFPPELHSH